MVFFQINLLFFSSIRKEINFPSFGHSPFLISGV